jgi:hypothetical protein
MSPKTPTLPPNDRGMWRRLVARAHPDTGGDNDLFIWAMATRETVCGGELGAEIPRREASRAARGGDCVPFDQFANFEVLTDRAVMMAVAVAEPFGYLLRQLADCQPESSGPLYDQQQRGASYKSLAAIAHRVDMGKVERRHWYRVCESIPLSQRHAGHILGKLQRRAAA